MKTRTLAPFPLTGVGGAAGSGVAKFGLATTGQPFIDIVLRDLPQPSSTEVYSIWLMTNPGQRQGTPLTPITLPASGAYHNRFPIPSAVIPLLSKGVKTVDISRAAIKPLQKEILAAQKAKKLVITEPGTTVLRGTIPASERGTGGSGGASTTPGG